jgi:CubicO group peptidase (beta-lactamase class C family)
MNEHLIDPLGLKGEILFSPRTNNVAVTREGDRIGAVNDLNTRALGGVSGHAGLFGTTRAVQKIGKEYLKGFKGESDMFLRQTMDQFFSVAGYVPESGRALGMDTPARTGSSAGSLISAKAVGHTGFTGVSLWIDLDRGISMVLLTNRVILGEPDMRIKDFRPRIHDMLIRTFDVIRRGDQI